jgi:hypothetical protein
MEYRELRFHNFLFNPLSANLHWAFVVFAWESSAIVPALPFPKSLPEEDCFVIVSRFHRRRRYLTTGLTGKTAVSRCWH